MISTWRSSLWIGLDSTSLQCYQLAVLCPLAHDMKALHEVLLPISELVILRPVTLLLAIGPLFRTSDCLERQSRHLPNPKDSNLVPRPSRTTLLISQLTIK